MKKYSASYVFYAMLPSIVFGAMATEVFNADEVPAGILVAFLASLFVVVPILIGAGFEMLVKINAERPNSKPETIKRNNLDTMKGEDKEVE